MVRIISGEVVHDVEQGKGAASAPTDSKQLPEGATVQGPVATVVKKVQETKPQCLALGAAAVLLLLGVKVLILVVAIYGLLWFSVYSTAGASSSTAAKGKQLGTGGQGHAGGNGRAKARGGIRTLKDLPAAPSSS